MMCKINNINDFGFVLNISLNKQNSQEVRTTSSYIRAKRVKTFSINQRCNVFLCLPLDYMLREDKLMVVISLLNIIYEIKHRNFIFRS
jgi:hypothetical protein